MLGLGFPTNISAEQMLLTWSLWWEWKPLDCDSEYDFIKALEPMLFCPYPCHKLSCNWWSRDIGLSYDLVHLWLRHDHGVRKGHILALAVSAVSVLKATFFSRCDLPEFMSVFCLKRRKQRLSCFPFLSHHTQQQQLVVRRPQAGSSSTLNLLNSAEANGLEQVGLMWQIVFITERVQYINLTKFKARS